MLFRSLALLGAAFTLGAADAPSSQLLEDARILSSDAMQGRAPDTPGGAMARAYLLKRLRAIGVAPLGASLERPFTGTSRNGAGYTGVNLVGRIEGTGKSDRVLVIGAHYDHVGVRDGHIYNGADDNASGVAGVLAIAAALMRERPRHDVVIALWDAEERGLVGAKAFLAAPPIPLSRIAMNLNLDMIGRGDKGELWLAGAGRYPVLRRYFERLAAAAAVPLKLGHDSDEWKGGDDWSNSSDHGAFHAVGIPFAYLGVEDHPDVHQPTDDFDRFPQEFFVKAAATGLQAARLLDAELDTIAARAGRSG